MKTQVIAVACSFLVGFGLPAWTADVGAPKQPEHKSEQHSHRLPKWVVPENYRLHFTPNLTAFTFYGVEAIDIDVSKETDTIVLNALDLTIIKASINNNSVHQVGACSIDAGLEQARIKFPNPLTPGKYVLKLTFNGVLNDKLRGFYRSHYIDAKGAKQWIATTQMEPTDARRMFPCFDEPEMKATFTITVEGLADNVTAISNGQSSRTTSEKSPGKTIHFDTTPKMSSYLVALIVGDFKPTATRTVDGVPVTVWALSGKEQLGNYALEAACKILEYQKQYFGIPYPGKKLDLIAIPDFRSGAMENLGCITFREANLLVDEKTASNAAKRNVFAIVAHEIAHQWFGDLVTMKWWDDIWLNEAFASWMGTKTVEAIHPEWQELTKAILTRNGSMQVDELKATRAIHADVQDPKQAAEMFDSITYDKGESILWMLESYVGDKKFQEGIHDYLEAHTFGNATSEDLWKAIGKTSSLPVPDLMKSWVFQPGFPIIRATTTGGGNTLSLSQQRFFGLPGTEADQLVWEVPAVMRELKPYDKNNAQITKILNKDKDSIQVPQGWSGVVINAGGRGFYRTLYEPKTQEMIQDNFDWLTPEERLAFLSDIDALVWKGSLAVGHKLQLLMKAPAERDPIVQEKLVHWCSHPYDYLGPAERTDYEKLFQATLRPVKKKLGWQEQPGEADSVKDLRRAVITILGTRAQDPETISEARKLFKDYMKNRESIPADVAASVLTIVTYNGGKAEYDEILAALKNEKIPELEKRFLNSLTHFGEPELMDKTLNMVLSDEVRSQDGFRVLAGMLEGERTKTRTWNFVKTHWDEVTKKFPPRSMSVLVYACQSFDKPDEEADIKAFFASHDLPYARSSVSRMLEDVHRSVLYRERNAAAIRAWVKDKTQTVSIEADGHGR